ncbi:MAG: DUF3098 domain-containing protein [Saprospiraceae bacterium]|nr:DUF3098 domain-containing protein [Saprospiraceae bacterium]
MAQRKKTRPKSTAKKTTVESTSDQILDEAKVDIDHSRRTARTYGAKEVLPRDTRPLLFGKTNFIFFVAGLVVVLLGFFLMSGGNMPDPDTWDESIIYSSTRITLAPATVLFGLCIIIFGIFRGNKTKETVEE